MTPKPRLVPSLYLCPCCGQEWRPPDPFRIVNGRVYWRGNELMFRDSANKMFLLLYEKRGQLVLDSTIHTHVYGLRPDGGPNTNNFKVWMTFLNRELIKYPDFPFIIIRRRATHGLPDSGGYIMVDMTNDRETAKHKKALHSRSRLHSV